MNNQHKSKNLFAVCAILFLAGLANASTGKGQTTMLSRVRTIDDPELGELVRVALENLPETRRRRQMNPYGKDYEQAKAAEATARLRTVRLVTETYMHIKLLDSQIEQSEAKLASSNLPESLARELVLAKTELEYQRATKLAELREVMNIVPRHALGRKPVKELNGWLTLDVIGDSVLVFTCVKPFYEVEHRRHHVLVKSMSEQEAMKYALDYVLNRDHHPVRVDIMRNRDGIEFSEELERELIRTIKHTQIELHAEVHLSEDLQFPHGDGIYVLKGKMGFRLERKAQYSVVDGRRRRTGTEPNVRQPMPAEEFEKSIRRQLVGGPGHLPMKYTINHDRESKNLASQAEETIRDIAKKHGVEKLVEITMEEIDSEETH
jgi:hypothetical protein